MNDEKGKSEISILFSGGVDSTISALNFLEKGCGVHLLTFRHDLLINVKSSEIMAFRLKEAFGPDSVTHTIIGITEIFRDTVLKRLVPDILEFRGYFVCLGCKLCMHAAAIMYNRRNKVATVSDGNVLSATFDQTREMVDLIEAFYSDYDMKYIPFSVEERGLSNIFWEHEGRRRQKRRLIESGLIGSSELSPRRKYGFQPFCINGQINASVNERLFKANLEKAKKYFKGKKSILNAYDSLPHFYDAGPLESLSCAANSAIHERRLQGRFARKPWRMN